MAAQQQAQHMTELGTDAAHGPGILSVPGGVLFTHMAPHVLGDVAALRTTSRPFRTNAAVVVAEAAQSARLQLGGHGIETSEAHALGAALGSALSQCQQPKHLSVSVATNSVAGSVEHVLDGMRASGAHRHVAALHLGKVAELLPALSGLAHWPHLQSLQVADPVKVGPGLGSSLTQLMQLQSLSLQLRTGYDEPGFTSHTLHGSHLQQLTQLTSLSLGIQSLIDTSTQGTAELLGSIAALPQLRKLDLSYSSYNASEATSSLASALPNLTALTSLDADISTVLGSNAAAAAVVSGIAALPTLQHLGLPHFVDIGACAPLFSTHTALTSLRLGSIFTAGQEPGAARLLSHLARLQLSTWHSGGPMPVGRASWLAQLQEVTVESVCLQVLADLPPHVCIKASPGIPAGTAGTLNILCRTATTEQEVRDAAARLHNSPAVKDGKTKLDLHGLQPELCASLKPLAEAVCCVVGLAPGMVPHMAGWQLRCLQLTVDAMPDLPQLAQAALTGEGLCVGSLEVDWGGLHPKAVIAQEAVAAVQRLCQGLQGLRLVVTSGPESFGPDVGARCSSMRQELLQGLQQAVQGRGVEVRSAECSELY